MLACVGLVSSFTAARAALVISTGTTAHVTCAHHVCTATSSDAVINVQKIQNLLTSGNFKIVQGAGDIDVQTSFTWVSTNTLTFDASHSIIIEAPITVAGKGGLTLTTNDGGTGGELSFVKTGNVNFWSLASQLTIDGNAYTLVHSIATLASDIASNPGGFYALSRNYNASVDGTYTSVPIPTVFTGTLNGLGNTISKLSITDSTNGLVGLFADLEGTVRSIGLTNARIKATNSTNVFAVGILAGTSGVNISETFTSGAVYSAHSSETGGLVGTSSGSISNSHSSATVKGGATAGGLIGVGIGTISNCYATGAVTAPTAGGLAGAFGVPGVGMITGSFATGNATSDNSSFGQVEAGGLVGFYRGAIENSYATGNATIVKAVERKSMVGGLVGGGDGTVSASYSTGVPSSTDHRTAVIPGGLVGVDSSSSGSLSDAYWDTTSSGVTNLSQGAGNISNDAGITGMTTPQLQSGLPAGFDPSIWGENPNINGGLPYLLANPPPN